MWVSDLLSSATRLSYLPQQRLSTLQEHRSVRIDVCISTAPKKSSPRLDKSCKKTGFWLAFIGREFPIHDGRAFCLSAWRHIRCLWAQCFWRDWRWAPLLPAGDSPLQGDCKQADLLTVFLPCLSGNVSQEKLVWCLLDVSVISLIAKRGRLEQPRHIFNCLTQLLQKREPFK